MRDDFGIYTCRGRQVQRMSVFDHRVQLGNNMHARRGDSWFEQTGIEQLTGFETRERNDEFEWRLWCCM